MFKGLCRRGSRLIGPRTVGPRTVGPRIIGPRTVGPRGPTFRGPTVRPQKVDSWAPDSWAPGPNCPGPNWPPWKSGLLGPGQLGHVAMYKINWHLFPKCWQHISNTNIYITKCTFPYPAPQRAHRKPPTDIYPPNVGRIYPIQIYILQHVHSLTLGPKGRTENLQLTYFPQMLAAKIQ